jgi:GNAT superfamily N-acetyltransferase
MERKWSTRGYSPGDEDGILALWRTVFPDGESGRADPGYWYWQFRDPPAGSARIQLAVVDDLIVGQYAVIPMSMQVRGEAILGTLSLDTMTHPEYRRQGMFTTLASELYAELRRTGFPLTYGFPNENSIGGFVRKLQWTHVCSLPVYVKPLRPDAIVDSVLANPLLNAVARPFARLGAAIVSRPARIPDEARTNLRWLDQFDARADELWQEAYDRSKIALTRSAAFLNWRYFLNPVRDYRAVSYEEGGQLVAYAVIRCMDQFGLRGGMITDLVGQPGRDDALEAVLTAVEEHSAQEEMDVIASLVHGDRRAARLLKRNGFLPVPKRAFKEWCFGVRVNNDTVDDPLIADADNWYLTFGDTDVI